MANLTDIVKDIEDTSNNDRVHKVASVSALSTAGLVEGQAVELIGYYENTTVGGGSGVVRTARHNGGTSISLTRTFPTDWTNQTQLTAWFADSGSDELCFVFTTPELGRFASVASMMEDPRLVLGDIATALGFNEKGDCDEIVYTVVSETQFPAESEGMLWFRLVNGLIAEYADKVKISTNQAGIFGEEATYSTVVTYESVDYPVTAYTKTVDHKDKLEILSNNFDVVELSFGAYYSSDYINQTKSNTTWESKNRKKSLIIFGGFIPSTSVTNFKFYQIGFVGEFIDVEVPLPIASTPAEVADPTNFIDFNSTNKLLFGFSQACLLGPALTENYSSHTIGMDSCYVNNRDGTIGRSPNAFSPGIRTKDWFVTNCLLEGIAGQGALFRVCDNGRFQNNDVSKVWAGVVVDSSRGCRGTVMSGNTCKRVSGAFKADQLNDGSGNNDYNYDFNCTGNTFESFEQGKGASYYMARWSAYNAVIAGNTFRIRKDYLRFFDVQGAISDATTCNNVTIEDDAKAPALFEVRNGFPQEIDTNIHGFNVRNESSEKTGTILRIYELAGTNSNNITMSNCKVKTTNINNLGELVGMSLSNGTVKKLSIIDCDIDCEFISRFTTALTVDELSIKRNDIRVSTNNLALLTGQLTINKKLNISNNDVTVYPGGGGEFAGFVRLASSTVAASATIIVKGNNVDVTDAILQIWTQIDGLYAGNNTYIAAGTRGNTNDMINVDNCSFMSIQGDTVVNKLGATASIPIRIKAESSSIVFDNRNALLPLTLFTLTRI